MRWLLIHLVLLLASDGSFGSPCSEEIDPASQLALAASEAVSIKPVDTGVLAEVCAAQLKIGDTANARVSLLQFMANSKDGGGHGGPLEKLTSLLTSQSEPHQFEPHVAFLKDLGLGINPDLTSTDKVDRMIVNMIAKSASQGKYDLAESLLTQLSLPPERFNGSSSEDNTIRAALWINLPLVQKKGDLAEAFRIASLYKHDLPRTLVCIDIYELGRYEQDIESRIDEALEGVNAQAEIAWCRARLDIALGNQAALWDKEGHTRTNGSKAAKMLRRMIALDAKDINYLYPLVASQLQKESKTEEALEFLQKVDKSESEKTSDGSDFTKRMMTREFAETGDIEKAIKLSAQWSRADITPTYNRLNSSSCQPLYRIALQLAKDGRIEDATRIAMSIQDNFWRCDTLNAVGVKLRRQDESLWLEYAKRATAEAEKITPLADRQAALSKIIWPQVSYLDPTFDQVVQMIEPLSPTAKSSILGEKMESLLDENMPLDQVRQAIAIIEKGDTMDLNITANRLLARGEEDLAVETILKIELEYDYEFYLHDFFDRVRKTWSRDKKLDFISKAQKSERPQLIYTVYKSADRQERAVLAPVALDVLAKSKSGLLFHMQLMKTLLDDFVAAEDFELLERLVSIPLVADFQIREIGERIETQTTRYIKDGRHDSLRQFENAMKPEWAQSASQRAKIHLDISAGDFQSALHRVNAHENIRERVALRLLLAQKLAAIERN